MSGFRGAVSVQSRGLSRSKPHPRFGDDPIALTARALPGCKPKSMTVTKLFFCGVCLELGSELGCRAFGASLALGSHGFRHCGF